MAKRSTATVAPVPAANSSLEPNLDRALNLVLQLMATPGRSGEEHLVAEFIVDRLEAEGLRREDIVTDNAHTKSVLKGSVGNVIVKLPGTVKGPRLMLSAHMDTVPICLGSKPKREGNCIKSANPESGLGADDRAGVAVVLATLLEILERKLPHPPLTFCFLIQEEIGLYGARYIQQLLLGKPAMCFNWDGGSAHKMTIGATGGYRMSIDVRGIASHAGVAPEQGVSAIAVASLAIADLHRNGWHGLIEKGTNRGTSNIGVIQGGEATNVVTERVQLRAEARSHNPKFREKIVAEIEKAFKSAVKEVKSSTKKMGSVAFDGRLDYESFRLDADSECVRKATDAATAIGLEPELAISNGGLDANWLNAHGIPTVSLGCGQASIHTVDERLEIPQFENACRMALRIATVV